MSAAFAAIVVSQILLKQPSTLLLSVIYLLLITAYSHPKILLKSRGFFGIVILAICYGVLPYCIGYGQERNIATVTITMLLFEFMLIMPLLLAKDYKDLKGDTQTNMLTPLVRYGATFVERAAYGTGAMALLLFIWLSLLADIPTWQIVILGVIYADFVYYVHRARGTENRWIKKLFIFVLLAMSFILI